MADEDEYEMSKRKKMILIILVIVSLLCCSLIVGLGLFFGLMDPEELAKLGLGGGPEEEEEEEEEEDSESDGTESITPDFAPEGSFAMDTRKSSRPLAVDGASLPAEYKMKGGTCTLIQPGDGVTYLSVALPDIMKVTHMSVIPDMVDKTNADSYHHIYFVFGNKSDAYENARCGITHAIIKFGKPIISTCKKPIYGKFAGVVLDKDFECPAKETASQRCLDRSFVVCEIKFKFEYDD